MEEARKVLNDMCIHHELTDERVISYSQYVDTLVMKEQLRKLENLKNK